LIEMPLKIETKDNKKIKEYLIAILITLYQVSVVFSSDQVVRSLVIGKVFFRKMDIYIRFLLECNKAL
jgi:hypothetical protein